MGATEANLPRCTGDFVIVQGDGKEVVIQPHNLSALARGACLGSYARMTDEEKQQFVCPAGKVTIEEAAHPETIQTTTGLFNVLGAHTCRELMMAAARIPETAEQGVTHA